MATKSAVVPTVVIYVSENEIRLVQADREVDVYIVDYDCMDPELPMYDISALGAKESDPDYLATIEYAMAEVDPDAVDSLVTIQVRGPSKAYAPPGCGGM